MTPHLSRHPVDRAEITRAGEHWTLREDVEEWTVRLGDVEETVAAERAAAEAAREPRADCDGVGCES